MTYLQQGVTQNSSSIQALNDLDEARLLSPLLRATNGQKLSESESSDIPRPTAPLQCWILYIRTNTEHWQPPYRCSGLQSANESIVMRNARGPISPKSRLGETLVRPFTHFCGFQG
jgi:hypothetical protein